MKAVYLKRSGLNRNVQAVIALKPETARDRKVLAGMKKRCPIGIVWMTEDGPVHIHARPAKKKS